MFAEPVLSVPGWAPLIVLAELLGRPAHLFGLGVGPLEAPTRATSSAGSLRVRTACRCATAAPASCSRLCRAARPSWSRPRPGVRARAGRRGAAPGDPAARRRLGPADGQCTPVGRGRRARGARRAGRRGGRAPPSAGGRRAADAGGRDARRGSARRAPRPAAGRRPRLVLPCTADPALLAAVLRTSAAALTMPCTPRCSRTGWGRHAPASPTTPRSPHTSRRSAPSRVPSARRSCRGDRTGARDRPGGAAPPPPALGRLESDARAGLDRLADRLAALPAAEARLPRRFRARPSSAYSSR